MKSKQLFILIGILVLLSAGVAFKQTQKPAELATQVYAPLDLKFSQESVSKILLSKGEAEVLLEKGDRSWQLPELGGARADEAKIEKLLNSLQAVKGEVRGKSKSIWADFGIEDNTATKVTLSDSNQTEILGLALGSKKVSPDSAFVRQKGEEQVYLVSPNLFTSLGIFGDPAEKSPDLNFWTSLEFVQVDPNDVTGIEILQYENGRETVTASLTKDAGTWGFGHSDLSELAIPFDADSVRVDEFLRQAIEWRAESALDKETQDFGFEELAVKVIFSLSDGNKYELEISNPEEDVYYARSSSEETVFRVPKYRIANINRDNSYFFVNNPLGIDPEKVEKLTVRAGRKVYESEPMLKKWPDLTSYLNELKAFKVNRFLFDSFEIAKASSRNSIEIKLKDEIVKIIEFGDLISDEKKEYAVRLDDSQPFAISEFLYEKLFENLERLEDPADKV